MPGIIAKAALLTLALIVATDADAQSRRRRVPKETEQRPPPAVPLDKRDAVVAMPGGPFNGRPYWLALAQCGGVYFKLNLLYTDIAVHARSVKPDPKINAEYTKKLNEAIATATTYFDGAERFLMTDRTLERDNAVLTFDPQSRAAGDKVKTIEAALAAAKVCPVLYLACQQAYPKACSEKLAPIS
jgi:hypothetical protein